MPFYKAVIIIAGPGKGTRFRPLSLDTPKPLFPVAGIPIIQHHIEALSKIEHLKEILFLGFYPADALSQFLREMSDAFKGMSIRYLQEYVPLGTAGGLHHFRDQIRSGSPDAVFVVNGDICSDFPFGEMLKFHERFDPNLTLMATEATRQQSLNYGCVVEDRETHVMRHYVEKPSTYISSLVNCGVYVVSTRFFRHLQRAFDGRQQVAETTPEQREVLWLERDVLPGMSDTEDARIFQTSRWWSPVKTAASAIYANRHYLDLYRRNLPERLAGGGGIVNGAGSDDRRLPSVVDNVFIHPSAVVHHSAVLGPNVSVGAQVRVGEGARVKESIILDGCVIDDHAVIMYTVVGKEARVGNWCRIEGTPNDPNPNKPFAKMENSPLFNEEGRLNPSITIVGSYVTVPAEIILLNSIVLPNKALGRSIKNEIVL